MDCRRIHDVKYVSPAATTDLQEEHCTTLQVARMLGMAVRSVQMMVDRGLLQGWKTPGGHRRIARSSVQRWVDTHRQGMGMTPASLPSATPVSATHRAPRLLLIEDSSHFQSLIALLVRRELPQADLHIAEDGISGLAMTGRLDPDVLMVDLLLPGIDGATLIARLRSHEQFKRLRLVVVTGLNADERKPFESALQQVPVVHKTRLVEDLPPLLKALVTERELAP
jgi:excisionase family DNA binding protein